MHVVVLKTDDRFRKALMKSCKDGVLHSGGLRLEFATAYAPFAEKVPLSIATCEAGQRITLTLRSSAAFITPEQTGEFLRMLVNQICSLDLPNDKS